MEVLLLNGLRFLNITTSLQLIVAATSNDLLLFGISLEQLRFYLLEPQLVQQTYA